jgi:hypothetical protein
MIFDKIIQRWVVGCNGPAEAGAGRYRCPAYKLPDEKVKHHQRVRLQKSPLSAGK